MREEMIPWLDNKIRDDDSVMPWTGKMFCIGCGSIIPVIATAYGFRIVCAEEARVWTRIRSEGEWVEETYSAMTDNVKEQGYGEG